MFAKDNACQLRAFHWPKPVRPKSAICSFKRVFEALCAGAPRFILLVDGLDETVRSSETLDAAMTVLRWFASLGNRMIVAISLPVLCRCVLISERPLFAGSRRSRLNVGMAAKSPQAVVPSSANGGRSPTHLAVRGPRRGACPCTI